MAILRGEVDVNTLGSDLGDTTTAKTTQDPRVALLHTYLEYYAEGSWSPFDLHFYIKQLRGEEPVYRAGVGVVTQNPPSADFPLSTRRIEDLLEQATVKRVSHNKQDRENPTS